MVVVAVTGIDTGGGRGTALAYVDMGGGCGGHSSGLYGGGVGQPDTSGIRDDCCWQYTSHPFCCGSVVVTGVVIGWAKLADHVVTAGGMSVGVKKG